jgi:hypothetical protein
MPDLESFEQFSEWYQELNPADERDWKEEMEAYFNLELYEEYI